VEITTFGLLIKRAMLVKADAVVELVILSCGSNSLLLNLLLRPEQALGSPVQDLCLTRDFSGVLVMDFTKVENSLAWGRHFFLVWLKKIYGLYTKNPIDHI
jgi:hypothetical protein